MDGPVTKRPKLLSQTLRTESAWSIWYDNLEKLQSQLLTGCLCQLETVELHRPLFESLINSTPADFATKYTLQFISTVKILCELAVSQRGIGFICPKVSDTVSTVSTDKNIWEMLLQLLGSSEKFISYTSSKCLTSLLIWTKVSSISHVFEQLLESVVTPSIGSLQITHSLDVFRGIIDHSDEEEHPLQLLGSGVNGNPKPQCSKQEVDESESDIEVKDICITSLESWWTRLLTKFKNFMYNYHPQYEHSITTFLSLWQSLVSVKSNLNVVDTKHFYLQVDSFVSHLNSALPPALWKKLIDVFNEILCYGSTLSLQDSLPEEPCDLAHLILRHIKSRHFLQGVPFSKTFASFGGSSWTKPSDSEWESDPGRQGSQSSVSSTAKLEPTQSTVPCISISSKPETIFIGPTPFVVHEESEPLDEGDRPLLQKVVLLVLKCVAVTVRETKEEGDSSDDEDGDGDDGQGQGSSPSSDFNDMVIIERTVRDVMSCLDTYVKSIMPYHPSMPLCEWIVKLFEDQDDALVEAMLCALDSFVAFIGRIDITTDFYQQFNPVTTFVSFASTISEDKSVLIDLLMGNETSILLYILRLLKYVTRNWEKFTTTCGPRDVGKIMRLFISLKNSLVNSPHFPYNIDPVIRLLEICENNYESSKNSTSITVVQG